MCSYIQHIARLIHMYIHLYSCTCIYISTLVHVYTSLLLYMYIYTSLLLWKYRAYVMDSVSSDQAIIYNIPETISPLDEGYLFCTDYKYTRTDYIGQELLYGLQFLIRAIQSEPSH